MRKFFLAVLAIGFCSLLVAQQALSNDSIIKMIKAGLSEDVIVTAVGASPGNYDTSANGLIALKTAGASDKVISALVLKASGAAAAGAPAAVSSNGLPAGIDEVGIYYKDKSGAWKALMPEIVNFKTGGFMKSFASNGIVKGDVNGHVEGAHAKVSLTFPVTIAVYTSEGTAITEYQILRLRTNSNNREFRSVTGGVFHSSGGAKRDYVEFTPAKLAPRLYQITLEAGIEKGEYGILPPGAVSSSNMASGGKIYSISILE